MQTFTADWLMEWVSVTFRKYCIWLACMGIPLSRPYPADIIRLRRLEYLARDIYVNTDLNRTQGGCEHLSELTYANKSIRCLYS